MLGKLIVGAGILAGGYFGAKKLGLLPPAIASLTNFGAPNALPSGGGGTPAPPNPTPYPQQPNPAGTPPGQYSGPVPPFDLTYPGSGAWKSNGPYIAQYQGALTYLAHKLNNPSYDPHGVDEHYGPNTAAAVSAFERDHGLKVDGEAGPDVDSALDGALALVP